jgi:hypothetical protein
LLLLLSFIIDLLYESNIFFQCKGPQRLGPLGPGLMGLAVNPPLGKRVEALRVQPTPLFLCATRGILVYKFNEKVVGSLIYPITTKPYGPSNRDFVDVLRLKHKWSSHGHDALTSVVSCYRCIYIFIAFIQSDTIPRKLSPKSKLALRRTSALIQVSAQ